MNAVHPYGYHDIIDLQPLSSGMLWRFLKLEGQDITIDLEDYALKPIDRLLGILVWMAGGK